MSGNRRDNLGSLLGAVLAIGAAGAGCQCHQFRPGLVDPGVPRELAMASLPPYRVAPPDILLIDAIRLVPRPPYRVEPLDSLLVQFPAKALPEKDQETLTKAGLTVSGIFPVEPEGVIKLGLKYGSVPVAGLTLEEARAAVVKRLELEVKKEVLDQGDVAVELAQTQGLQQVRGEHLVRPDGTVSLGTYGAVPVA